MKILLIINLVILDLLIGFLIFNNQFLIFKQIPNSNVEITQTPQLKIEDFQNLVKRVGDLEMTPYPSPVSIGTSGQIKTVTVMAPTAKPTKNISYISIPGNGNTNLISWSDIAGTDFYFDKSEFPGIQSVSLQASIKLFNGSGIGSIRLLDVTHGIAVVGSEINTSSQTEAILDSGLLTIWSGRNLYRIQGKSNSSDNMIYNWGKLKVTTQN